MTLLLFLIFNGFGTILAYVYDIVRAEMKQTIQKKRRDATMGRMREKPRYNVISMRISDEERNHLESLMNKTHKSVSDVMREAMDFFTVHYEQAPTNRKSA